MTTFARPWDRVREHSSDEANRRIDRDTDNSIRRYSELSDLAVARHIEELDREWDIERMLQMNASMLALSGLVLGATRSPRWLLVPATVLPFLLQHAVQGWCPPMPVLRRLGFRTRSEIDRERYELAASRIG
jgi:hypothetical protein